MTWLFWLSLTALAFTYFGYPLLLIVILKLMPERSSAAGSANGQLRERSKDGAPSGRLETVSVVLVARNEESRIGDRLANLMDSKGVPDLEIVLVCDGCSDATAERARNVGGGILRLVELDQSKGKAHGVNVGVGEAKGEIVVFADARQRFDETAVARLLSAFENPLVAAASGSLEIESSEAGTGAGVDLYWRLEKMVRHYESRLDSCIGCTGAIYAIRRALFEVMPEDTILDDVVVPMRMAVAGGRVKFISDAIAYDSQKLAPDSERRRKTRTLAGNFQMMMRYPEWLVPWRNRLWWQLIAHKYLRLAGPALLVVCLVSNLVMMSWQPMYLLLMLGQILFYCAAFLGMLIRDCSWRLLTVPAGFLFLQWLCVRGFFEWLRRSMSAADGTWK